MSTDIGRGVKELLEAHGRPKREVYLDGENSVKVYKKVVEEMLPYFNEKAFGNPSITHKIGWESYEAFREAASYIADKIGTDNPQNLIFTHSGTEANNLAIKGFALANKKRGKKIVISDVEHLSVVFPAEALKKEGFEVVKVPVDKEGFIDLNALEKTIDEDTLLVSIIWVNHEIGTIEPMRDIVKIVRDKNPNVVIHTDAADAFGKIPIDVKDVDVDMMTLSSQKIGGPKGVGALYVKKGIKLKSLIQGQVSIEQIWPGVENIPLIMGFYAASKMIFENFEANVNYLKKLRDRLIDGILESVPYTLLNGPRGEKRAPDNVNISFLYCEGEALTVEFSMNGVYVSSGSACTSRVLEPSHVLLAIGREYEEAHGSLLMKVTLEHTEEDIDYVLSVIPKAVERIRKISSIKPK